MRRVAMMALVLLVGLALGACSPKKLEEPDAGKPAKVKKEPVKNPYAGLVPTEIGRHDKGATHVAWSPDGQQLVSTGRDNKIKLWDLAAAKLVRTFEGHTQPVMMAAFSKDGKSLVSASFDETARVWDTGRGKQLAVLKEKQPKRKLTEEEEAALAALPPPQVNWAAFTPDGSQVLAACDDFALKLYDVAKAKLVAKFEDEGCRQRRVIRRRDAAGWISSAGCMDDGVAYIKFWDETGKLTGTRGDERHDAHFLTYDAQARFLVAADGSTFLNVFSAQGSFLKQIMVGAYHFCLTFGPDDQTLLVGTDGGEIFVYKVDGWTRIGKLDLGGRVAVDGLALHPTNGSLAAALRDGRVVVFKDPVRLPAGP